MNAVSIKVSVDIVRNALCGNAAAREVVDELCRLANEAAQIKEEYLRDRAAYRELIGTLYPGIVYNRLEKLRARYEGITGSSADLPMTPPPNVFGQAPRF